MTVRTNRVPIMLNDDELQAIDDWRFANKVGSRSAAMRRLMLASLGRPASPPAEWAPTAVSLQWWVAKADSAPDPELDWDGVPPIFDPRCRCQKCAEGRSAQRARQALKDAP